MLDLLPTSEREAAKQCFVASFYNIAAKIEQDFDVYTPAVDKKMSEEGFSKDYQVKAQVASKTITQLRKLDPEGKFFVSEKKCSIS